MHTSVVESHVLIIETDTESHCIELTAAVYSLGRDPSNAIVLPNLAISRRHAMLLRVPLPEQHRYCYRLLDGDITGKLSKNGIKVNDKPCHETILNPMDTLEFGGAIQASYYRPQDLSAFKEELRIAQPNFHSLKAKPVDAKQTMVYTDMSQEINAAPGKLDQADLGLWNGLPDDLLDDLMTEFKV